MELNRQNKSSSKEIRNLLGVIGCGVASAILLSAIFLYNYGPSGRYLVQNALLAPELTTTLTYNDTNQKTGGSSRFVFEAIEFSFFQDNEKKQKLLQISSEQYSQFYKAIISDKSLLNVSPEIIALFNKDSMATLSIKVRTESHAAWQDETKIFQQVNIVYAGDYYRIQLHDEQTGSNWIYYENPGIYKTTMDIVIPQVKS